MVVASRPCGAVARVFVPLTLMLCVRVYHVGNRFVPDTEVVQHQLAQQELDGMAALSYEEYLRRLTQAVDTEVRAAAA